jgi:hypothetical protein
MDKKIAKMDMETFRQLKEAENERDKWCNLAGVMHQYLVDGDVLGALQAYEQNGLA